MDPSRSQPAPTYDSITPPQFLYEAMNGFDSLLNYDGFPVSDSSPCPDDALSLGMSFDSSSNTNTDAHRRQRNETEQRRRGELRDAFQRLKDTLPIMSQRTSKTSLLDQAVAYIRHLKENVKTLQTRLTRTEEELSRQRNMNEGMIRAMTTR